MDDDSKWKVEHVQPPEVDRGYFRAFNAGSGDYLVVSDTHDAAGRLLGELVADANRGAQAMAEDEAIDRAVDAGIVEARERTPAESADGFLRDALVMLADRKRFAGDINCGSAVRAIGKALERVGCMIALESLERSPTPSDQRPQEAPDAP